MMYVKVANHLKRGSEGRVQISFSGQGMTDQSFLRQSMITSVLAKYRQTGLLPHRVDAPVPLERQTRPDLSDYSDLVAAVREAQEEHDADASALALGKDTIVAADKPLDDGIAQPAAFAADKTDGASA